MSVGVCIINRNGIALAADSAGTFTGNKMFYNSMNKVFSLSRQNVYGAITYGATTIHNVSIDQILKEFRKFLDSREALEDYYQILPSFQEFIRDNRDYYQFDVAEKSACVALIKNLVVTWGKKIKSVTTSKNVVEEIDNVLAELQADIDSSIRIEDYDISQYIHSTYSTEFDVLINIVVPELKIYEEQKEKFWLLICDFFNLSITKESSNSMGLFFAGYGSNDAFPKFVHIEVYNVVGGKVKFKLIEKFAESSNNAKIIPLAQNDVILTFCKGISNTFINYIPNKVGTIINSKIENLPDTFSEEQKAELKVVLGSSQKDIYEAITSTIQKDNVDPILNSVQLIPLPEMAFLAESLVNITSLKRTFALDGNQQTVGGPTDVAVLSKGDGFVWIKRKLYFDNQINPNYLMRLSNEA